MKLLKSNNQLLLNSDGKALKLRPDTFVEPLPDVFMFEVSVDDNTEVTLPLVNTQTNIQYMRIALYDSNLNNLTSAYTSSSAATVLTLSRSLSPNTEYYFKIYARTTSVQTPKYYDILVRSTTANGTGIPTEEAGYKTVLVNGDPISNEIYSYYNDEQWYKFKTDNSGTYYIDLKRMSNETGFFYNYNIDWDDGNYVENVMGYDNPAKTHVYQNRGNYIIKITGLLKNFQVNDDPVLKLLITKVISWGDVGLETINFRGCTALTLLPNQTGKLTQINSFYLFCDGCTSLSYIPYGIFFGNTIAKDFTGAFRNCSTLTTIPSSTFIDNINAENFDSTFYGCSGLRELPSKLFQNCNKVTSWSGTFTYCTNLTTLPEDLFYRNANDDNYELISISGMGGVFGMCTGLTELPQRLFSSPLPDENNYVKGSSFYAAFTGCNHIQSLPSYFFYNQNHTTTFLYSFSRCTSLVSIGDSCFENCTSATTFGNDSYVTNLYGTSRYGLFGHCSNLVSVGKNCFKNCLSGTQFGRIFYQCVNLTNIGENIFSGCISATSYFETFQSCSSLEKLPLNIFDDSPEVTNFGGTFNNTRIHSGDDYIDYQIPENIFQYNNKVTSFSSIFGSNPNIHTIPENIFDYTPSVTNFSSTFNSCTNLFEIPSKLFRNNPLVTTFDYTFYNTKVSKIPTIIENEIEYGFFHFNTLVSDFSETFMSCDLTNSDNVLAIPQITFYGNSEVTSFYRTFESNPYLQSIPDELFINNSKVTNFGRTFYNCNSVEFTSIPPNLFVGNSNAQDFSYTFYGTNIETIPETLFASCVRANNFSYCFYGTKIISIPSKLFGDAEGNGPRGSLQDLTATFMHCDNLQTIGADLFKYNINISTFYRTFYSCDTLQEIPQDLFKLDSGVSIASDFREIFYDCINLRNINTNIFAHTQGATNFFRAFYNCHKLKPEPTMFYNSGEESTRFLNKSMNFQQMFYRTLNDSLDLVMDLYFDKNGSVIQNSDNYGSNYLPYISRYISTSNTPTGEVYIKIYLKYPTDSGYYNLSFTGGSGLGNPIPEVGVTNLYNGQILYDEYISGTEEKWYKFQVTTNGSYYYIQPLDNENNPTIQSTAPDLWNCNYTTTPVSTGCWSGAGNNETSLSNYLDIPPDWK